MDSVFLEKCSFQTIIGINEKERAEKQELLIDLQLYFDIRESAQTNNLEKTANYLEVYQVVKKFIESKEHILVESVAESIAKLILNRFPVNKVKVRISKPKPAKERNSAYFGVQIERNVCDI